MEFKVHLQLAAEAHKLDQCHAVLKGVEKLCKFYSDEDLNVEKDKIDTLITNYKESVTQVKQVPLDDHLQSSD